MIVLIRDHSCFPLIEDNFVHFSFINRGPTIFIIKKLSEYIPAVNYIFTFMIIIIVIIIIIPFTFDNGRFQVLFIFSVLMQFGIVVNCTLFYFLL